MLPPTVSVSVDQTDKDLVVLSQLLNGCACLQVRPHPQRAPVGEAPSSVAMQAGLLAIHRLVIRQSVAGSRTRWADQVRCRGQSAHVRVLVSVAAVAPSQRQRWASGLWCSPTRPWSVCQHFGHVVGVSKAAHRFRMALLARLEMPAVVAAVCGRALSCGLS